MGKRVSYFDRQFLRAEDFQAEQGYHLGRRRGVSAGMFRPGVAAGMDVVRVDATSVRVTAGLAIDGLGREIVLDEDSGAIGVDAAVAVEIWIAYAETPSDPVSYLGADEQRFTRTDEAPTIVPVPPGNVPADGVRLAVVPPGGDPDVSGRPVAGPRDGSVAGLSLADDAVTSRALAEADGASNQDTGSGAGVKTDHLQDKAVTSDKLADDVVDGLVERTIDKLLETGVPIAEGSIAAEMLANDAVSSRALAEAEPGSTDQDTSGGIGVKTGHLTDQAVTGPKLADGAVTLEKLVTTQVVDAVGAIGPGENFVSFEALTSDSPAFYLIYVRPLTVVDTAISWKPFAVNSIVFEALLNGILIENHSGSNVDVRLTVFRLGSLIG